MIRGLPTHWHVLLLIGMVVANIFIYKQVFAPPVLAVHVRTVGEETISLIRTPGGKTILIDTGPDASILRALGTTVPVWQRHIDMVVLTGTTSWVQGGIQAVKNRYRIPAPLYIGTFHAPYGSRIVLDHDFSITVIRPATISVSYGTTSFSISSSTPKETYIMYRDGTVWKN